MPINRERIIRLVRVTEFVGPESWIRTMVAKSWLQPGEWVLRGPSQSARELARFEEVIKEAPETKMDD